MELTLSKDGDLTRVTSTLLSEEPRPRLALLESGRTEHRETIVFCSWCDKLLLPFGVWMEPEAAVEKMGYFEMSTLPAISWGICPSCLESANAGADSGAGAGETGRVPPPRT